MPIVTLPSGDLHYVDSRWGLPLIRPHANPGDSHDLSSTAQTTEDAMGDELQQLPAVGPSITGDLRRLGVRSVKDLARRDPERLYKRLCEITGQRQDPCVLYTFRCAVYAARTPRPKAELLKWWAWKGRVLEER